MMSLQAATAQIVSAIGQPKDHMGPMELKERVELRQQRTPECSIIPTNHIDNERTCPSVMLVNRPD
jgi:hypothetical protein